MKTGNIVVTALLNLRAIFCVLSFSVSLKSAGVQSVSATGTLADRLIGS